MRTIKMMIILLTVVFLVGCGGSDSNESVLGENPYEGGSQGVVANFEGMGVIGDGGIEEIFEGERFPIEVRLVNKGEDEIEASDVKIKIKGVKISDFEGIAGSGELVNTEKIEEVSDVNPDGGEITVDFTPATEDAKYNVELSAGYLDLDFFADVIYKYETNALVPKVCFKEDLRDETICEIEESKDVYSSGAPLQVTNVIQKSAGSGKISLEFEVENVGSGSVTKTGEAFDSRYDQFEFELSDSAFECKGTGGKTGESRLADGKSTIVCKLIEALPEGTLYTKQVDLTLNYDYKEVISRSLRIKQQG